MLTNLIYSLVAGGATAPMAAPTAYAVTTHSAHFPANQRCQRFEGEIVDKVSVAESTGRS
ncbi:hypothetical protein [Yersinia aleksiciae]|uniref:hypothetical protein n=1 Tax=Yersinia aleksiciae TaxID=263819 RepID=UPI00118755E3|nr:hypothetical protein [Yersinia aleksiciae]